MKSNERSKSRQGAHSFRGGYELILAPVGRTDPCNEPGVGALQRALLRGIYRRLRPRQRGQRSAATRPQGSGPSLTSGAARDARVSAVSRVVGVHHRTCGGVEDDVARAALHRLAKGEYDVGIDGLMPGIAITISTITRSVTKHHSSPVKMPETQGLWTPTHGHSAQAQNHDFQPPVVQRKDAASQKDTNVALDFEHLLSITLEAKRLGKSSWRDLSRRERAFAALALNRADWLQSDNLTIGQALELVGELASLVGAVEWAVTQ